MNKLITTIYSRARAAGLPQVNAFKASLAITKKLLSPVTVIKHMKVTHTPIKHNGNDFSFEIELSNDKWDKENQRVDNALLERLISNGLVSSSGDVDHEKYYKSKGKSNIRNLINQDTNTEGLYQLNNVKYENGKALAIVDLNNQHQLFDKYLAYHKAGKFLYASAEFPNAKIKDGVIVDADSMGWTITDNPVNRSASIKQYLQ